MADFPLNAVQGCEYLRAVTVSAENSQYQADNGVLLNATGTQLILYPQGKLDTSYAIPDGVIQIGDQAFRNADSLTAVSVPASVTAIGKSAFSGCTSLESFSAESVLTIDSNAFFGCYALTSVHPGPALTGIGAFAFGACSALTDIVIPAGTVLDPANTIFGSSDGLIITGTVGSFAYDYALAYGIAFNDPDALAVTAIEVTGESDVLERGDTMRLTVAVMPDEAVLGKDYTWYTSNGDVAFVDHEDVLHAVGCGSAVLTARTGNGLTAEYTVEVQVAVRSVSLAELPPLAIGMTAVPEIAIVPAFATNQTLIWVSDDPGVASVDENGLITGVNVGVTELHATTHNGLTADLTVEVYRPIESLTLTAPSYLFTLNGYKTGSLLTILEPTDATDRILTYSSSNPSVLTVDETGMLTALRAGTVTVTVAGGQRYGEDITESVEITVHDVSSLLTLPPMLMEIEEEAFCGDTFVNGVLLGSHVTSIGSRAFADMIGLHMIVIPDSVTSIAADAFDGSPVILICSENSAAKAWEEEHDYPWIAQ